MLNRNIKLVHYMIKKYPTVRVTYRNKSSSSDGGQRQDKQECPKDGSGKGFYYTVGGIIVGTGALVAYAKYDEDFRSFLRDHVPGSDEFIAFVTAEEASHLDYIVKYMSAIKAAILNAFAGLTGQSTDENKLPPCDPNHEPYTPPKPAYKQYQEEKKLEDVKKSDVPPAMSKVEEEARKMAANLPTADSMKEQVVEQVKKKIPAIPLNDIVLLEKAINEAGQVAVRAFTDAICILREHSSAIFKLVEESVENLDQRVWNQLKDLGAEKEEALKKAESNARVAFDKIQTMRENLANPNLAGGEEVKKKAVENIDKILAAVDEAKKTFDQEKARLSVTDKYWKKVLEARKHFAEELEILFPSVRIADKDMKLAEGQLDLFILYAFQNILFYQKELTKIDTITKTTLKQAIDSGKNTDKDMIAAAVENQMDNERRRIGLEFQKRMLMLRAECEKDMRVQMKRQAEAHQDHLAEAMELKGQEIERKMRRELDEQVMEAKTNYKKELATLIGRLKALDDVVKKRAAQDKKAQQSQILWSACQTLDAALRSNDPSVPSVEQLRPLQDEIQAISKAAAPGDELVGAVVETVPREALQRGVFSEVALRDRFLTVERVARRVALLPEGGASMPVMLLSYLQSLLIVNNPVAIPAHELANLPFDPKELSTFDILQRARFWLDRGDFAQVLRYMNLLEGAPRAVARDWVRECRIFLEVSQAAEALMTHAAASGLIYS